MSNGNKSARRKLERIFGKKCMIEAAGIRYIPVEKRRKIKGYTTSQDKLTYHHIKERSKGGKATVENGAIIKGYNHAWLHQLPRDEKEMVNERLKQYKLNVIRMLGNGEIVDSQSLTLDFNFDKQDCITIPVYPTTEKDLRKSKGKRRREDFNRAKVKREFQRKVDRYFQGREDDDDYIK